MATTRIYNVTKLPIASTIGMVWATYEVHRIHRGTHPYVTPRLEAAGIIAPRNADVSNAAGTEAPTNEDSAGGSSIPTFTWTSLNGLPIPTLAGPARPAGSE